MRKIRYYYSMFAMTGLRASYLFAHHLGSFILRSGAVTSHSLTREARQIGVVGTRHGSWETGNPYNGTALGDNELLNEISSQANYRSVIRNSVRCQQGKDP
jgi:hypothetical protein